MSKAGRKQIYDWASLEVDGHIDIEIGDRDPKTLMASVLGSARYYQRKVKGFQVTSKTIGDKIRVWRLK